MGLREGDVIALVTPNLPETAVACLGILEAGLVVTTVNPFYTVGWLFSLFFLLIYLRSFLFDSTFVLRQRFACRIQTIPND